MLMLDIRTLNIVTTCIALLFSLWLFSFSVSQNKFKGFKLLAVSNVLIGLGMLFVGFRYYLPNYISVVIANTLIVIALVGYFEGGRRFLEISNKWHPIGIIGILMTTISSFYYTYEFPSINSRVMVICLIASCITALTARDLFIHSSKGNWRVSAIITGCIFAVFSLFQFYHLVFTATENEMTSFMFAGSVHAFSYLFVIALVTGPAFGFFWMVSRQLQHDLTELTIKDQLTGILNRRGLNSLAHYEFSKRNKVNKNLTVMMLDIDHFKKINDTYGHHIGDHILVEFASLISKSLRPSDIFARIGGEEFVIVLPFDNASQAIIQAERLKKRVELFIFKTDEHVIKITASIGVASIHLESDTLEDLILKADQALYYSKDNGRNVVTLFDHNNKINELTALAS
jgi:diguanylate cyclase (GGDEF)-like protein